MRGEADPSVTGRPSLAGTGSPLLAGIGRRLEDLADARGLSLQSELLGDVLELHAPDAQVFVVVAERFDAGSLGEERLLELGRGNAGLLVVGEPEPEPMERLGERVPLAVVSRDASDAMLWIAFDGLVDRVGLRRRAERRGKWLHRYRYELGELIDIARALTQERDLDRLLALILEKSRMLTGADAGSLYVVETPPGGEPQLRFKVSQNDSVRFEASEFTLRLGEDSIVGYAAVSRTTVSIDDVYELPADVPYRFDPSFDRRAGYRTRSTIAVPMISAEDEIIGVIQLINRKRDPSRPLELGDGFEEQVVPFDARSRDLLETLATQAGIALENAMLYDEIRRIFEGFVRASVHAIEQRDPTTSGHSVRVSELSVALMRAVDREESGPYGGVRFGRRDLQQLEYAALLHDFGKIGVREQVLVKARKLYPEERERIRARIDYAICSAEVEVLRERIAAMQQGVAPERLQRLEAELEARRAAYEEVWRLVEEADEPRLLPERDAGLLRDVRRVSYRAPDGRLRPILTEREVAALGIERGSLTPQEVEEIRSHVVHTFDFLSAIPWGKNFSEVPRIAGLHHEKLDGSGYPHGLTGDRIPLPTRIMTVCDIFDALTARDRPYKKAVPVERALDILALEVAAGKLDAELVRLFREARVFRVVQADR